MIKIRMRARGRVNCISTLTFRAFGTTLATKLSEETAHIYIYNISTSLTVNSRGETSLSVCVSVEVVFFKRGRANSLALIMRINFGWLTAGTALLGDELIASIIDYKYG